MADRLKGRDGLAGAIWSSLNAGAGVVLPFAVFIFFARVLLPSQIGLIVLALACAEFVKAFGLPGLYEALLQRSSDRTRYHETVLAVLLLTGCVLLVVYVGAIALLGKLVAGIVANRVALLAIGARIPFDLATLQPQAALAQRLSYRRMASRSIVANAGAGAIGIGLALTGAPLAGLVAYQVGQSALILLFTAVGTQALARPRLHRDCLRHMAHEATMSSVVRLVAATNNYVDQIIIAVVLNNTRLAYFNLAKRVESTFVTTASAFSAILFQPLFAVREGTEREQVLRRGLMILTLLCGLPTVFLAENSTQVVPLVFGPRWTPAAPVVALLAVAGLARALGSVHGALLSVSGRNRQLAIMSATSAASGILVVVATARHGVVWCAAGLALKNLTITAWMATMTRGDVPRMARAYLTTVILPLALMLLGAGGGRLLVGIAVSGAMSGPFFVGSLVARVAAMAASALVGGLCGLAWFACRSLRTTAVSVPVAG